MIDPGKIMFNGTKGDVICRPSRWTDVAAFFLVNYALHAFTVLTEPGSGAFITLCDCIRAIILPYTGSIRALIYIFEFAISGSTALDKAKRARSLCMVVPHEHFESLGYISPNLFNVHGQHPIPCRNYANPFCKEFWSRPIDKDASMWETPDEAWLYRPKLAPVPEDFVVQPPLNGKEYSCEIASNYSILKTFAAIIQIIYGSWELYEARGMQISKFGYAAYSLTVIPYVFMSFLNLIASMCRPSYPSLYIVYYRGKVGGSYSGVNEEDWYRGFESNVSGAVGYVYGDPDAKRPSITSTESVPVNVLLVVLLVAPYILIGYLTSFQRGDSTTMQRFWMVSSLVLGQLFTILIQYILSPLENILIRRFGTSLDDNIIYFICSVILSGPTIGAFYQVAQMIRQGDVCVKI